VDEPVKGRGRQGRGSLRAERAENTRRRIVTAARSLFASRGYAATTLAAVADEAGVAVQTVYATYRSKAGLLRAMRENLVRQPRAEDLYREALAAQDAGATLDLFARSIRARWEAGADVVAINADAAAADTSLRAELDAVIQRRRRGLTVLATALDGRLRPGMDRQRATAILDALTLPEVYLELTGPNSWSADTYETWLAASLRGQLL
jgi:AcrR family transcriptional regulator